MLTPMSRAGGLPANLELRMGRMKAGLLPVTFRSHSLTGGVTAVPPDDVYYRKAERTEIPPSTLNKPETLN